MINIFPFKGTRPFNEEAKNIAEIRYLGILGAILCFLEIY